MKKLMKKSKWIERAIWQILIKILHTYDSTWTRKILERKIDDMRNIIFHKPISLFFIIWGYLTSTWVLNLNLVMLFVLFFHFQFDSCLLANFLNNEKHAPMNTDIPCISMVYCEKRLSLLDYVLNYFRLKRNRIFRVSSPSSEKSKLICCLRSTAFCRVSWQLKV